MDEHGSNFIKRQTTNLLVDGSTKPTEPWIHLEESQMETSLVFKSTWRMVNHKNSIRSCDLKFIGVNSRGVFVIPPPPARNGSPLNQANPMVDRLHSHSQVSQYPCLQSNLQLQMIRFAIGPPQKVTLLMYILRVTCISNIKVACITLQKT